MNRSLFVAGLTSLFWALATGAACSSTQGRHGFEPDEPGTEAREAGPDEGGGGAVVAGESGVGTFAGDGPTGPVSDSPCGLAAAAKGYAGCDFRVAPPQTTGTIYGLEPCFAVFLTNIAAKPAQLKVSLAGKSLDPTVFGRIVTTGTDPTAWKPLDAGGLPPGTMLVLFLSDDPKATGPAANAKLSCPVTPAVEDPSGYPPRVRDAAGNFVASAGRAQSFHIESDEPVVAYDIMPFGGARSFVPSAQILLPTAAWGNNYVGLVPPSDPFRSNEGSDPPWDEPSQSSWMSVGAMEDGTTVEISAAEQDLLGAVPGDGVAAHTKKTLTLSAGEYVLWLSGRQNGNDASGTIVASNKPVSLTVGDVNTVIASSASTKLSDRLNDAAVDAPHYCCLDSSHQMLAPVSGLGSEYVVAPYSTRRADGQEEPVRYRFLGIVDGTSLSFDPPIAGGPTHIDLGKVADFEAPTAFRVKSQDAKHPFYMAQMMSFANVLGGSKQDGTDNIYPPPQPQPLGIGDPEFVTVLPAAQLISQYTFLTDPTFATTTLSFVRIKGPTGFSDVDLACLGPVTGWQPIGADGVYEYARLDLQRKYVPNGGCGVSLHSATSTGKFGVQVWGVDWFASYAYPAGGTIADLNAVVVPPR